MKTYIHYGSTTFDRNMILPITEITFGYPYNKPNTGLWASDINAEYGWREWCESSGFRDCDESNSFKFRIRYPHTIFTIETIEDAIRFIKAYHRPHIDNRQPIRYCSVDELIQTIKTRNCALYHVLPDFKKMNDDGYSGLEITLSKNYGIFYDLFYSWDCDSIVVWNPDEIIVI